MSKGNTYMVKTNELYKTIQTEIEITHENISNILSPHLKDIPESKWINKDNIIADIIKTAPEKMTLNELYYYLSDYCAERIGNHYHFNKLASSLCVDRLHKCTPEKMKDVISILYNNHDVHGEQFPLVSDEIYRIVMDHSHKIQKEIDMQRDYKFDYFGIRTLERSYLFRIYNVKAKSYYKEDKKGQIIERPQHMIMRVALGIHGDDLKGAFETYHLMSQKYFTHATPTLFNAGTARPQLSSCFVADTEVLTLNAGIKKIQDVKIGDEVVTHTGKSQKVVQLHENPLKERDIYSLEVVRSKQIKVTENHKFMALINDIPQWTAISDLQVGDYLAIPSYKGEEKEIVIDVNDYIYGNEHNCDNEKVHIKTKSINRYITLNNDFAEFLGYFYKNGHIEYGCKRILIKHDKLNDDERNRYMQIGSNAFGVPAYINANTKIAFSSPLVSYLLNKMFKRLVTEMPIIFYKAPTDIIQSFLDGVFKAGKVNYRQHNQLYHLCRSRGMNIRAQNATYSSREDQFNKLKSTKEQEKIHNGITYLPIKNLDKINLKPDYVYTLGVENDHSYNVEGLICENCFLLGAEDSLDNILESIEKMGKISKYAGGIGIHLTAIRAKGSLIRGTNGLSDGLIPLCSVLNKLGKYINQGGKRSGSIACFCKDTEVFTANEGVKKIQDVKIGDLVITHKNRTRPVVQVHKNPLEDRKIYKLEVEKNKDIYVTGNHKFWSCHSKKYKFKKLSLGWNSIEELKAIMDNKETTRQACYISTPSATNIKDTKDYKIDVMDYKNIILNKTVKELISDKSNGVIAVSKAIDKNGYEKTAYSQTVNRIWNITEDLANLFGMWLGDGHVKKERIGGNVVGIGFTVHKDNIDEIKYIDKICKETFGCNVSHNTPKLLNVTQITVNSHIVGTIFMELFGSYFDGKNLPNMIFSWPKNLVNNLMAGLITTDGHITKKKTNASLGLSNEKIMTQLYHLCRNNGIDVSFVKSKMRGGMTCDSYTMSIPLSIEILNRTHKLYTDGRIEKCRKKLEENNEENDTFLKILRITETDRKDEYVYTLGVSEDHSYTVEGLIAQNCYIEPWHSDIFEFCELRKTTGDEENRARDLFLALWVPNLFMKRVESDGIWSLMCPDESTGLYTSHGDEFERLYIKYEKEGKFKRQIKARELYYHILDCQIETGMPYFLYKDHCNNKSNQKNLGTIRSSNLCVDGDTYILTKTGQHKIKDKVNQKVEVWNGDEWSKTTVRQTGSNKELVRVELSNGSHIDCTPEHNFYKYATKTSKKITKISASELYAGDYLISNHLPNLHNNIFDDECVTITKNGVPLNHNKNTKNEWLKNFLNGHREVFENDYNREKLFEVKLMAQTLGIESKIHFDVKNNRYIFIILTNTQILKDTYGIEIESLFTRWKLFNQNHIKVLSVTKLDIKANTYCFTEPKKNMGMFNGVLAGNCAEIVQYSDGSETSVCNLASLCLPRFIINTEETPIEELIEEPIEEPIEEQPENKQKAKNKEKLKDRDENYKIFDFDKLQQVTKVCVRNLNKIIDKNFYPTEDSKRNNLRNRPLGLGVQGLADVYNTLGYPFGSPEARKLNKQIFETIYFAALEESCKLTKEFGKVETFTGSPFSQGQLQWHLWGLKEKDLLMDFKWGKLIEDIKKYGTRNSLLTALMPTASTSQIMGNCECFEPITTNLYVRSTNAGEFIVVNENLMRDLIKLNLWDDKMRKKLLVHNGSIQNIKEIPKNIKDIYKTAFEVYQKDIITQAAERGPFIDQSQSMNLFMEKPNYDILHSCHMLSYKLGNKTSLYYLRSKPAVNPIQFGIDPDELEELLGKTNKPEDIVEGKKALSLDSINFGGTSKTRNVQVIECVNCSG